MLPRMPKRPRTGPLPDVFETFSHRVDEAEEQAQPVAAAQVVKGAGISLGLIVLAGLAFVLGFWAGTQNEPDLAYDHLVWEAVIKVGFAALCGLLAMAVALALATLAIGIPWVRRQRERRR